MFGILALICIILGFVAAIFKVHILFDPLVWFVAAIAFSVISGPLVPTFIKRGGEN